MHFQYIVTASGHGFHQFVAYFNGQDFLTIEQIRFLTFLKMKDSDAFKEKEGELKIIEISIRGN